MICLRFIEVAAQFDSMQKWGPHGPQEALTSPSQHTASPTPSTCIIIISDHIVYVWGWLREAYLRNGEEKKFHVQSAWVLPTLGSVRTPGDRMSVKTIVCFSNCFHFYRLSDIFAPSPQKLLIRTCCNCQICNWPGGNRWGVKVRQRSTSRVDR